MKRESWVIAICLAAIVGIGWLMAYSYTTDTRVEFVDHSVELAVQAELQLDRPIREQDLINMTSLSLRGRGVESLEDLHYFKNLRQLNVRDNFVSDLSPLKYTPELQSLNVQNNRIDDLSHIPQLTELRVLNVEDNLLHSLEGIESLVSLVDVNARNNKIHDLTPVSKLPYLEKLNVRDNHIQDLTALESLFQLQNLNVRNNHISSFEPLEDLPMLKERLYVRGNPYETDPTLDLLYHRIKDIDFADPSLRLQASHTSGYMINPFELELTSHREGIIRYTEDGSEPTSASVAYLEPIPIKDDAIIRAKLFLRNGEIGETLNRTFIFGEPTTSAFPTLSIVMNPDHLYGKERGIIASQRNMEMVGSNWEREVLLDYYEPNGKREPSSSQRAGIRVYNRDSIENERVSFVLFSRERYGQAFFEFDTFKDMQLHHQQPFILHHSTLTSEESFMSQVLYYELGSRQGLESASFIPVHVKMNGEELGMYLSTAEFNPSYLASLIEGDKREIEIVEGHTKQLHGAGNAFNRLISLIEEVEQNPAVESQRLEEEIDIDNLFRYLIHHSYFGKKNLNEGRFWYSPDLEDGWRWINEQAYMTNIPETNIVTSWLNEEEYQNNLAVRLFTILMQDEQYKDRFVRMYEEALDSVYNQSNQQFLLEKWQRTIKPELSPFEQKKWDQEYRDRLLFIANRADHIREELNTLF